MQGSSVEILLYGATVISWNSPSKTNPEVKERFFVSGKATLDGSKPVRGGIPVVFPAFGAPTHPDHAKLSQHGFARSEVWTFDSTVLDSEAGVSVRLGKLISSILSTTRPLTFTRLVALLPNDSIKAKFDKPFELYYVVTLAEHQLSTDLHVKNTGLSTSGPLEFQALFHNYIRAPANEVAITPLQGLHYYDKTESTDELKAQPKPELRAAVDVRTSTDSVYENAPGTYHVAWPGDSVQIKTKNLKDVVVWNPQEAAGSKIGDMEPNGW